MVCNDWTQTPANVKFPETKHMQLKHHGGKVKDKSFIRKSWVFLKLPTRGKATVAENISKISILPKQGQVSSKSTK